MSAVTNPTVPTDTHHKALTLNLDSKIYGTIAEIGAGQEVSRWLFRVGGAAGTVAKTISAYDMSISDQLYGKGPRYVSKERAVAMLGHEYERLLDRLRTSRGSKSTFFVFADTVSARNYQGTNECHGWMGLRFQLAPDAEPNEILLHVNMQDNTNALQQEALGILGINLLYGAYFHRESVDGFLRSLLDGLHEGRLEIDTVLFSGPNMRDIRPLDIGIALVRHNLGKAVLFDAEANVATPTEIFHNRPLVLLRGMFVQPPSVLQREMLDGGLAQLKGELAADAKEPVCFFEMKTDVTSEAAGQPDTLKERILQLLEQREWLLLTQFRENYLLTRYLRRFSTDQPIRLTMGVGSLVALFAAHFYSDLPGQILEGLARFLSDTVKVYVKPMPRNEFEAYLKPYADRPAVVHQAKSDVVTIDTLSFEPPLSHLFDYLRAIGTLVPLEE